MILTTHPVHHPSHFPKGGIHVRAQQPERLRNSTQHKPVAGRRHEEPGSLALSSNQTSQADMTTAALVQSTRKRRATSPECLRMTQYPSMYKHHSSPSSVPMSVADKRRGPLPESPPAIPRMSEPPNRCDDPLAEHVIVLSSIEQCMPRAYIRVCFAYRLGESDLSQALERLNGFVKRTVDAKPYLAGYIVPVDGCTSTGPVEIRFGNEDYINYPNVEVRELYDDEGQLMNYDDLDAMGFPPSKLHPEKVAVLPAPIADEKKAPVFRAQANIVNGGIVVSLYLHHCISDGTGLGLLVTGSVQNDELAFKRHLEGQEGDVYSLGKRLAMFANHKSVLRTNLSYNSANHMSRRHIMFKRLDDVPAPTNPPGRGCVISFADDVVARLRSMLNKSVPDIRLSRHDTLQALIWCHMVRARAPVVKQYSQIKTSKLQIPVNIRNRLKPQLPDGYFGAAVDFATAELDLRTLMQCNSSSIAQAARTINKAVAGVDDDYIRQSIALARSADPNIDIRDLLASNMNRVTGADLYITSWEHLELYDATLDMGLGRPQWVRKPWSRDPGSCIILPRNEAKAQFEVVIQMTEDDMGRLLSDKGFTQYVSRVID